MQRKRLFRLVQLALTVLACGIIIYVVDWGRFFQALKAADFAILGMAYALFVADRVLMGYKWALLLQVHGIRVPLWERWGIYSLATLAGGVLPSTVGADALRVAWLWRRGARAEPVTSSVVVERVIGFAAGLGIATAALLYLSRVLLEGWTHFRSVIPVVLFALLAMLGLIAISLSRSFDQFINRYPRRVIGHKLGDFLSRTHSAYASYRSARGALGAMTLLTIAEQLLTLVMNYVLALALGIEVPLLQFCAAVAAALLVSRLPVTIDGIGMFEGVMIFLLALAGIDPAHAVALAVVGRILSIAACLPGAILLLALTDLRPADLWNRTRSLG